MEYNILSNVISEIANVYNLIRKEDFFHLARVLNITVVDVVVTRLRYLKYAMYIAELDDVDLEISNTIKEVEKYRNVHWCKSVNDIVDELLGLVIVLKGYRNECEQPK